MSKDKKPLNTQEKSNPQDIPAGCFSSWLRRIRLTLLNDTEAVVNCGECNACCKSSYFIHIRLGETRTLSRIPREIVFPAPGQPQGNVLLGYNETGYCPMLIEDKCSIYEDRPLTCRTYDCRIFAAAGIMAGEEDKSQINERIRRWKFKYPSKRDLDQHSAVKLTTKFLRENSTLFPAGFVPSNPTQLALLAIKVYEVFLKYIGESGQIECKYSDSELAIKIIEATKIFES